MTDFEDLELNKSVDDMDADEAKQTLSEFMDSHKTNRTAYDELSTELDEVETEYQEKLEAKEELIADFRDERASEAAEYVNIPADLVASRFSLDEIEQIIEEGAEFADSGDGEGEEEDDSLTTFADRAEKGETSTSTNYSDRARDKLSQHGLPVGGE
jgi:hypothetical protein